MNRAVGCVIAGFVRASLFGAAHPITFNEIAPILYKNCAICHHEGGSAPFSLLTYSDVRKRARQIGSVTERRLMPPWLPEPGYGHFAEERRLTETEIRIIQEWVADGAVEGNATGLPAAPTFAESWMLGKPDLELKTTTRYVLPARGSQGQDVFRNFILRVPVETTRYVRAFELRPGNPKIFHHANILVDRGGTSRTRESESGMGFEGMDLEIESESFDPDGYFLSWKPGSAPSPATSGMSWRVDPGTDLVLNLHMRPDGKPEVIQLSLGIYFADKPPTQFPMLLQLENDIAIDIPPDDRNFIVKDDFTLPTAVEVLGVYPHAHYLGKDLQGYAILPNGEKRWLVRIKNWNLDWQGVLRYAEPVLLPKGSTVHMQWTYDNSAANLRNPNDPPRRIVAGNQAKDEMGHLWLQVLPVHDSSRKVDPRLILQEAMMRHRLRGDPDDYIARYNLGSVLQILGKLDESADEYRRVLRLRPDDPVALNSMGTVLKMQGKTEEAIQEYRQVLRVQPGYSDAQYNLGRALLGQGMVEQAIDSFDAVLRAHPGNADAHHSMGLALQFQGRTDEAIREYREELHLRPGDLDAEYNLGRALLTQGKSEQAIASFDAVIRAHPADADAHHSLGLAFAGQGNLRRAQSELEQATRLKPDDAECHNDFGMVLARQDRLTEAATQFREALRLDPRDADAHNNLGIVIGRQGKMAEAVAEFEEALRANPQFEEARENLKRAQAAVGRNK